LNIEDLEKLYPGLAAVLAKSGEDELDPADIKIETASSGAPALSINGIHIDSPRDPEKEARRLVEAALAELPPGGENRSENRRTAAVILGFGLGYIPCAAAELAKGLPLIIVEKHPILLRMALENRNLDEFLSTNKIIFVLGSNSAAIDAALSLFETQGCPYLLIKNHALIKMDPSFYGSVESRIKVLLSKDNINRATQKRFGKRWVRNLSRNLWAIRDLPGIIKLEGILKAPDLPVFLAAAGPSLEACGPMLKEIAERCVTVAVDTSLRFLLRNSVMPDFVLSVDPQYWNFRHLDQSDAPGSCLVAESAVYPACLRHPFGRIFLGGSLFPLGRFIESKVDPKGELGAGGSVATSAWDFARLLGASSVWIAGLDLSFPSLKTHFRGALFEEKSHAQSRRFLPAETQSFRAILAGGPFPAKARSGGTVLTDKRLSLYAAWFENRFRQFPEVKNYSPVAEGLELAGLVAQDFETLLALPKRRREIDLVLEKAFSAAGEDPLRQTFPEKFDNALASLFRGLKEIKALAEEAAGAAEAALKASIRGSLSGQEREKILGKLKNANDSIYNSEVKETAGFLFPDLEELDKDAPQNPEPLAEHLDFSARFYRALADSAGYNLKVLSK
jgi:hypothetical protein